MSLLLPLILLFIGSPAHAFKVDEPFKKEHCSSRPFTFRLNLSRDFLGEVTPNNWGSSTDFVKNCDLNEIKNYAELAVTDYQKICGQCLDVIAYVSSHGFVNPDSESPSQAPSPSQPNETFRGVFETRFKVDTTKKTKTKEHYLNCGKGKNAGKILTSSVYTTLNKIFESAKCKTSQLWVDACQAGVCVHDAACNGGKCVLSSSAEGEALAPGPSNYKEWAGKICRECDFDNNKIVSFGEYHGCWKNLKNKTPQIAVVDADRAYLGPPVLSRKSESFPNQTFIPCHDITSETQVSHEPFEQFPHRPAGAVVAPNSPPRHAAP